MKKRHYILALFVLLAICTLLFAPFIGMQKITPGMVFMQAGSGIETEIFWKIRFPRTLSAFFAGAALAISGMTFQALFRNSLATPFTLGVSSGAAFGAALYVKLGALAALAGISGGSVAAFIGALLSIFLVYGLTKIKQGFSTGDMLLAGVAVSFFFTSLILFIQYISDFTHSFRIIRWLMGGIEIVGYKPLLTLLPFVLIGTAFVLLLTHELNLMLLGEDIAMSRGVSVDTVKTSLFFATSLMVGGVVSITGPIGFVGMMSPHICRLLIGHDHRFLAPVTFLFGGVFLTLCDTMARTVIAPAEIPVGVITALLGGPFFLWLLVSGSSEKGML